jgi:allophanate hydrolase
VFPACRTQDCVSIFALTAGDGARVLAVASGFDGEDAYSREAPRSIAVEPVTENVRIGVARDGLTFFGDRQAEAAYRASVARLSAGGARVVEIDAAPFIAGGQLLYAGPWVAERLAALRPFLAEHPDALHEVVAGIIRGAEAIGAAAAFDGFYALADLMREADAQWREMDVLLLPTAGTTYRIDDVLADPVQLNSNLGRYTNFVNLMDLSALAVPAGFRSDGLPFGVTLIGRAFEDGRLLALGDLLHRSVPGARLGATATALSATPPVEAERAPDKVQIAVVGAHLTGQPLNNQLVERKAQLLRTARTASGYSFYALANTTPAKPGLVFDGTGDGNIEVEVWEMETAAFGSFVALVPQPLAIGTVKLANETTVKGFLCEAHAVRDAIDITAYGGWRAWLAQTA